MKNYKAIHLRFPLCFMGTSESITWFLSDFRLLLINMLHVPKIIKYKTYHFKTMHSTTFLKKIIHFTYQPHFLLPPLLPSPLLQLPNLPSTTSHPLLRGGKASHRELTKTVTLKWGWNKLLLPAPRLSKVSHYGEWTHKSQFMHRG